ncbi:hypothetical protein [Streptomyces sp. NPDC020607]|uniref:hypothetical protein n=1 Tax=Streptomyces sp. NPDC020607 TaxID=3365082 RepID=UPI0037A82772
MSSPFPTLTPTDRIADPRCGLCPEPEGPACGAPASWHVAWKLIPGDAHFSLLCAPHMTTVQADFVYVDRHPAAVVCDMPGTGWLLADPSQCVLATTESAAAWQAAAER